MKKLKTLTISLLMLSLVLCGCSSKKVKNYNISVVAGNNSCSLLHDYILAKPYLKKIYTQGGQLSIVNSDGAPYVVKSEQIEPLKSYTTSTQKKSYLEKYTSNMIEELNSIKSKSAEIDLIESLNCASKSFSTKSNNDIVCFVSGLSTKGLLNMTTLESLRNLDINKTVSNLKEAHGMPNLQNINNIYLYSVGQVASYQKLSKISIHKEKEFLTKLLVESGMNKDKIHFVDSNPISNKAYKGPNVSKVGQDTDYNAVSMVSNNYNDIKSKLCLTGLEFQKNSSILLNAEKLNSVVSFLNNYAGAVDIFGTTAYDKTTSDERLQKLGYERALTVKNSLLEKGVDPTKINKVSSLSYKNLYHKNEWNEQGFNDEIAKLNRTVVIKDSQS
ncbi:OmpA family protein [Catenibacterium faecis]|uniref:OmpA family protein n=1 Tax=Catenibacterium faecis TaxID=2764323 RepID=A0ABR7KE10_9FIRM|nr:OmpA family protein [Catenibacterium faecis]MBC6010953.1 OmpA family protein [Catenibacterium faecis]